MEIERKIKQLEERVQQLESVMQPKETMNLKELSMYLGLSRSAIYQMTSKGQIPFYKKAKHLFFDLEEIKKWVRS